MEGVMKPDTLEHNGVVERHNCTLMDMVRCMMSHSSLPNFLWGDALKNCCLHSQSSTKKVYVENSL